VIGDKEYWGKKVVLETRPVLIDHFFNERGIDKIVGQPLARNIPAIFNYKTEGWQLEGVLKSHRKSMADGKRLDQMQFAMLKDEWRAGRLPGVDARGWAEVPLTALLEPQEIRKQIQLFT